MIATCRSERTYQEALDEARARQPKVCRVCGSTQIQPTFLAPREWDCSNLTCLAIWTEDE